MLRLAREMAEQARVAVRHVRQKAMAEIKGKGKAISEDERRGLERVVDDVTKKAVSHVEEALKRKEAELQA
jgi:ribosome recycling factor